MNGRIDWGLQKAALLFLGLIFKGLAMGDALAIEYGPLIKQVASVVWMAFDGAFLWLLAPPKSSDQEDSDGGDVGVVVKNLPGDPVPVTTEEVTP